MAIVPINLAKVKANGRRFILISENGNKVQVKGEVLRVSGCDAVYGPPRTFLRDRVEILEADLTEALLKELNAEELGIKMTPSKLRPKDPPKEPKRKAWVKKVKSWDGSTHLELTSHARKQLELEGYDVGVDGLGNYLSEDTMSDAAMDAAQYHYELTADGVPEGYRGVREVAADYIYDGMLRACKERKAQGKSVVLETE